MVDAIERSRGRRTPIFVDIRFSRSGRAAGFRQGALERVAGRRRYNGMRGLGNSRIGSGRGGMKISDPGADDLLDLIVAADRHRRRVLFFCQCKYPRYCHRAKVASLVRQAAARRGIGLTTTEWPGGEPVTVQLRVPEKGSQRGLERRPACHYLSLEENGSGCLLLYRGALGLNSARMVPVSQSLQDQLSWRRIGSSRSLARSSVTGQTR